MTLLFLFTSPEGRINRLTFLWAVLAIYILNGVVLLGSKILLLPFISAASSELTTAFSLVAFGLYLLTFWCLSCLTCKRFHDVGVFGWAAFVLFFFASAFALIVSILNTLNISHGLSYESRQVVHNIYYVLWGLTFLALVLWPGQKQRNRYGLPPGQKTMMDVAVFE